MAWGDGLSLGDTLAWVLPRLCHVPLPSQSFDCPKSSGLWHLVAHSLTQKCPLHSSEAFILAAAGRFYDSWLGGMWRWLKTTET